LTKAEATRLLHDDSKWVSQTPRAITHSELTAKPWTPDETHPTYDNKYANN